MNHLLKIRTMTESDLEFADSLRAVVHWNQTFADWRRLLEFEPAGCFLAEWNGVKAGTATTTRYGPELAWIGMLLVHPEFRRKGIARALLQTCIDHLKDVRCVKLDATPLGKQLYDRCEFADEWTLARWELNAAAVQHQGSPEESDAPLRCLHAAELESFTELDNQAFGGKRTELLKSLAGASTAVLGALDDSGQSLGYGMLRRGSRADYLGPVVAASAPTAGLIVRRLAARSTSPLIFWDIPDSNDFAIRIAVEMRFAKQRPLVRMYRNSNPQPGDPSKYFGIADPSLG